ncbi:MAG: PAS domain-containing protein [Planctomycetota bacterium]|nr:PAS domain-containing protein [Planctomycetota bacterium]
MFLRKDRPTTRIKPAGSEEKSGRDDGKSAEESGPRGASLREKVEEMNLRLNSLSRQAEELLRAVDNNRLPANSDDGKDADLRRAGMSLPSRYLELLLKNSDALILVFDREERLVFGSDPFLRLTDVGGFQDIDGIGFRDLFQRFGGEDCLRQAEERLRQARKNGKTISGDAALDFSGKGNVRLYAIYDSPLLDEDGRFAGIIVSCHDVTERRKNGVLDRLRAVMNATPLPCCLWDQEECLLGHNQALLDLLGLPSASETLAGTTLSKFEQEFGIDIDQANSPLRNFFRVARETGFQRLKWTGRSDSGRFLPLEIFLTRINEAGDRRFIMHLRDLRESKARETAIHEAEMRVRVMLNSTPMACALLDEGGRLLDCNRESLRMFGIDRKSDYLMNPLSLHPILQPDNERSADKWERLIHEALADGRKTFEWMYLTMDRKALPAEVTLVRVKWRGGFRLACYSRDLRTDVENRKQVKRLTEVLYRKRSNPDGGTRGSGAARAGIDPGVNRTLRKWLPAEKILYVWESASGAHPENDQLLAHLSCVGDLDIEEGLGRLNHNTSLYLAVLRMFCRSADSDLADLRSSEITGNIKGYSLCVRALENMFAGLGCHSLLKSTRELEKTSFPGSSPALRAHTEKFCRKALDFRDQLLEAGLMAGAEAPAPETPDNLS